MLVVGEPQAVESGLRYEVRWFTKRGTFLGDDIVTIKHKDHYKWSRV